MAELYENVVRLQEDDKCMNDLRAACGLPSTEAARAAYRIAVPVVMSGLVDTSNSTSGAASLLASARSLRWTERSRPEDLFARSSTSIGDELVTQIFGGLLPKVRSAVAADASLSEAGAEALLETTSMVSLATVAGSISGQELDMDTLVGALQAEREAVPADPAAAADTVQQSADERDRLQQQEDAENEQRAFIAAGAAAAVGGAAAMKAAGGEEASSNADAAATDAVQGSGIAADNESSASDPLVEEAEQIESGAVPIPEPVHGAVDSVGALEPSEGLTRSPAFAVDTPAVADPGPAISTAAASGGGAATTTSKDEEDDGGSKKGILLVAGVGLLALLGAGYFLLSGGDDAAELTNPTTIVSPSTSAPEVEQATATSADQEDGNGQAAAEEEGATQTPVGAAANANIVSMAIPMLDIENPDGDASGTLNFDFDTVTGEVCYSVSSANIAGPYRSHIHVGEAGVKGGIVVDLGPLESGAVGCVDNLPVDTNAILANRAGHYAELHDLSEEFTIRGQLSETISGDIISLAVPMTDSESINPEAEGVLNFDFNTVTGEVCYSVSSANIAGPYRSHIHVGEAGVKGGIVVDLGPLESGAVGCVDNLPVDTNAILANKFGHYAELHDVSEEFTIRGQLSNNVAVGDGSAQPAIVDTAGGGARTVLDGGTIYLEGDVPDQATADGLVASLAGVDASTPVVNNLNVVAGAPLPSGRVIIADAIFFDVASDDVKSIPQDTLDAITALATSREDWILTVVGHTDDRGTDTYNLELSLRRAGALRDLLAQLGVPDENLRVRGAGETAPIGDNGTDEGRAQNRRIEFEFTPQG